MRITINQTGSTAIMTDDYEFKCTHDNAIIEPACCSTTGSSGYIECGCGGMDSVYCPDCQNEDMSDDEVIDFCGNGEEDYYDE